MKRKEKKQKQPKVRAPRTPFAWVYFFISLLLVAGGIAFVVFPLESANWTARILGGATALMFLFLFVFLCAREKKRDASFFFHLVAYLLAILAGGYLIFSPDIAMSYLAIALGVYALMDAGFKLRLAISGCRYNAFLWWALTVTAGLSAVGGLVLLRFLPTWEADTTVTAMLMGITMLCAGLQNFIGAFEKTAVEQAQAKEAVEEHTTVVVIDGDAAAAQIAATQPEAVSEEAAAAEPPAPAEAPAEEAAAEPAEASAEVPAVPPRDPDDMTPYELYLYLDEIIDSMPVTNPIPEETPTEEATDEPTEEPSAPSAVEGDECAARAEQFDAIIDRVLQEGGESGEAAPTDEEIDAMMDQFIGEITGELNAEATKPTAADRTEEAIGDVAAEAVSSLPTDLLADIVRLAEEIEASEEEEEPTEEPTDESANGNACLGNSNSASSLFRR